MEIETSDSAARDANKIVWQMPDDMRLIARNYPVTQKGFSIELLKHRFKTMDKETQQRTIKVIQCLERNKFYGHA
tara:strand:- start:2026 stop:2250 length:225 start_codon:yes stop_codon:yes gene_type:complete